MAKYLNLTHRTSVLRLCRGAKAKFLRVTPKLGVMGHQFFPLVPIINLHPDPLWNRFFSPSTAPVCALEDWSHWSGLHAFREDLLYLERAKDVWLVYVCFVVRLYQFVYFVFIISEREWTCVPACVFMAAMSNSEENSFPPLMHNYLPQEVNADGKQYLCPFPLLLSAVTSFLRNGGRDGLGLVGRMLPDKATGFERISVW